MANSIRTPRQGVTATSRRIAQAVDNEEWQKFRLSLKGISTADKLRKLQEYSDGWNDNKDAFDEDIINVNIRVENYLKALARGGQIAPVPGNSAFDGTDIGHYHQSLLEETLVIRK